MEVTAELLDLVLYGRLDRKMECLFNNNTSYKGKFMLFKYLLNDSLLTTPIAPIFRKLLYFTIVIF